MAQGRRLKKKSKEKNKEKKVPRKNKTWYLEKDESQGKRRFIQNTSEDDSEKENDELRLHLTIAPDEEKEVDYEILDRKYPIKEWKTECLRTKPRVDKAEHLEEIHQNVVIRSNGQKRYFSTLMRVMSIFDRDDLNGDLMVMFNPDDEDEFWNSQQDWNIVSWKLHGSLGVHTLVTEEGLVIHMLVEKKYPLRKKVLLKMMELKLESEEDSTMALELIRFVKKLLAELEPKDSDGDEEDLLSAVVKTTQQMSASLHHANSIRTGSSITNGFVTTEIYITRDSQRFYTSAGNLVKEILLKLNLPDHSILKDGGKETIEADRLLAEKLQEQEREQFTIEERAKFTSRPIAAQENPCSTKNRGHRG
ncbi:hypothetical protein Tco_0277233 [Tanacetum coccineum]